MSRVAGDIEHGEVKPNRANCAVLAQSVKDFLETPKAKLRISECLCGKGFDPDVQLMRAFLIELKHIPYLNRLKREEWFDDAKPLIRQFMGHAQHAEQNSQEAQIQLLDELDRVAKWLWGLVTFKAEEEEVLHWSVIKRRPPGADMFANVEDFPPLSVRKQY
jgi:hypothetical protein